MSDTNDETMAVIRGFLAEYGYHPSVRDVAGIMGVSPDTAHRRMKACEKAGLIERGEGSRAIRIVEEQ